MAITKISLEESILAGELSLEKIFSAFTDGVYDYSIKDKITFLSDNFFRLLGYEPGEFEVTDERWDSLIHPEDLAHSSQLFYNHIDGKIPRYIAEYRMLRKDGSYQWISCTGQLIGKDQNGNPSRVVGAIKSIHSKKQLELGMKTLIHTSNKLKGNKFFQYMVKNIASLFQVNYVLITISSIKKPKELRPLAMWDRGHFNRSFVYRVSGTPTELVYSKKEKVFVFGDLEKEFPNDVFIQANGIVGYYGLPIRNTSNEVIGHLCVMNEKDVVVRPWMESMIELFAQSIGSEVERIKSEEKLHELNKLLDQQVIERTIQLEKAVEDLDSFFYKASHDLRAPITTLEGIYNLIETEIDSEEKAKLFRMLGFQISNIKKLNRSIIEVGNIRNYIMNPMCIQLRTLIEEVIANQDTPTDFDVQFNMQDDHEVTSDEFLLKNLLKELISNSIKHRDSKKPKSYVQIEVTKTRDFVKISITDNGKGIPDRYERDYFQLFLRASTSSSGYGLGLYKGKLAADKAGIALSITSKEGHGTTATLKI